MLKGLRGIRWRLLLGWDRWCYRWRTCNKSEVLDKAAYDPFDYAVGLKSGAVIHFNELRRHGDWILLRGIFSHNIKYPSAYVQHYFDESPFTFERGIEIHVSEIAWLADAPHGS